MRKLTVHVLATALGILLWSAAAQAAAPPSGDIPKLSELRLYFMHLANIDAAADKADAEGTPGDTAAWRRFEQENAGLTETEAALLKDVAFRCNRALEENLEGQEPMEIVRQAADELRAVLGPSAFEAVSQRIMTFLRPAITNVPVAAAAGWGGGEDEEEIPIEIEAFTGPSVSVYSLLFKLQDGNYMANCGTAPNDTETLNRYAGAVTMACEVFGGGLSAPIQVPCGSSASSTTCSGTYPPAPPGRTRVLSASHGLRMKLASNVCLIPSPVYYDPLAFCRTGRLAPNYVDDGDVPPLENGQPSCWDPETLPNVCKIATTSTAQISFIEVYPGEATVYPGGTVKFSGAALQTTWTVVGPGTIDNTGLYTAPASITSEQTATVKGCDAYAPGDCDTSTVTLKPLQVQVLVSPTNRALPPTANLELTATILPPSAGGELEWTATPELGVLSPEGNNKVNYTVFRDDLIPRTTEVTIKACVKPALTACGIAKVTVEKLLFMVTAPKTKLAPGESVQVTAFVGASSVPRNVVWSDPKPGEGTLSVINPADPFIRLYTAPPYPIDFGINIEVCLEDAPGFCAYLHIDLGSEFTLDGISSDTGRWQAGVLTPFTITGTGFTEATEVYFGDLDVTLISFTDTTIRGKVNIVVPTTAIYPRLKQTYPTGGGSDITRSPIPVEPATIGVVPPGPQIQAGGTVNLTATCLTSTALGCTSLELPNWTASPGTITPTGMIATYTAPASVQSSTTVPVSACWSFGEQSRCAPAQVTVVPSGPIVSVTPETADVEPGKAKLFTAQVTNDPNTAVTWSIQPAIGIIKQSGLYTAPATFSGPATVTVTATSQADSSRKDTATVTLVPAPLAVTSTPSPATVNLGTTVTWTATASGGTPSYQYAIFRKKAGTTSWIPALDAPFWQPGSSMSWTTSLADAGTWEIRIGARGANTPANAPVLYDPGSVQVQAPLSIACSASPAFANPGTAITWTVTASGGTGTGRQYALFRRRAGTTPWTPDVTTPAWQASNVLSWTPLTADAGPWDFYIWAKDSGTPPTQNAYGYGAGCNPGPVKVVTPLGFATTPSPASAYYGQPITWTLTATGGDPATTQFAWGRRRVGATDWIPAVLAWQSANVIIWTPTSSDVGAWEIAMVVRDASTPPTQNGSGYAAYANPGNVNVVTPLAVSGTMSPASATHGNTLTWTATASGGTSVNRQFAFFRRRSGTTPWTPDVTTPAWQTSNVLSWTPGPSDVGTWDTYVWVKDSATPPTMNTHGYAAGYNPGGVQIVALAPLTVTGSGSPGSIYHGNAITWIATGSGGSGAGRQYAFFRRRSGSGTSGWIPAVTSPAWQSSSAMSWTPSASDVGTWDTSIWFRDANTPANANGYGYGAYYTPGTFQVLALPTVTGTGSPASANHGSTITWTVTASGAHAPTLRYALFRRRPGTGTSGWIPAVTSPAWQAGNVLSWTPTSPDVGTWEIYIWVKDGNTPAGMNTYGYAAGYGAGPVEVTAPVYQSHAPIGWVDGYDRQHVWGWACDPDYPIESNRVDFWSTSWQYLGSAEAYLWSSSPINSACGGGSAHYFDFHHNGAIPPGMHFWVWSIDLPYGVTGNDNRVISGSGAVGGGYEFVIP